MNPDTLIQSLQKGFHVTLGATAFLVETLQDSQRRDENLNRLQTDLPNLTEEWAIKGETTEREARNFVETILSQQTNQGGTTGSGATATTPTPGPTTSPDVQSDLQELTTQIAAIREELESLRQQDS